MTGRDGERRPRRIAYFEVRSEDGGEAFAKALGWEPQPAGEGYAVVDTGRFSVPGGLARTEKGEDAAATVYVAVRDVAKTLERAVGMGASVAAEPAEVRPGVHTARLRDPAGNVVGLVSGDAAVAAKDQPSLLGGGGAPLAHFELRSDDPGELAEFYGQLFGWVAEAAGDQDYLYASTGRFSPLVGFGSTEHGKPGGVPYFAVGDVERQAAVFVDVSEAITDALRMAPGTVTSVVTDPHGSQVGLVGASAERTVGFMDVSSPA